LSLEAMTTAQLSLSADVSMRSPPTRIRGLGQATGRRAGTGALDQVLEGWL
jgi:hypothetical protein